MKLSLKRIDVYGVPATLIPTIEHVFVPTIGNSFDNPVTTATVSIDIDGVIYHKVYSSSSEVPSDKEVFKLESTSINATANTEESIDLSSLSEGDYVLALYAENNYEDGTEIEEKTFTIE